MIILIALVALGASLLTLFSGFGLGTILTPVFGIFFPIEIAIALTGIVHLLNNLFKLGLVGKQASSTIALRFGLPSVLGGFVGAGLLSYMALQGNIHTWEWNGKIHEITFLKLVIALLMVAFALMETIPVLKKMEFGRQYLTVGGLVSGFFGGLSGNQGALRSAFLVNAGLSKEQFIATGVVIACLVDCTRLPVYFSRFESANLLNHLDVLVIATLAAFVGAYFGSKYLKKVTFEFVKKLTTGLILVIALLLGTGVI